MKNHLLPWLRTLVLSLPLLCGPLLWSAPALGQNETSGASALPEYRAKLDRAREIQGDLSGRLQCVNSHHDGLMKQGSDLEGQIGDLRRQEEQLAKDMAVKREQERLGNEEFRTQTASRDALAAQAKRARDMGWTGLAFGGRGGSSAYLQLEEEARQKTQQIGVIEARLNVLRGELAEHQRALDDVRRKKDELTVRVGGAETVMKRVRATLADLRTQSHDYNVLIDDFSSALAKGASVDGSDASAAAARQLARLSAQLDQTVERTKATVVGADTVLPACRTG